MLEQDFSGKCPHREMEAGGRGWERSCFATFDSGSEAAYGGIQRLRDGKAPRQNYKAPSFSCRTEICSLHFILLHNILREMEYGASSVTLLILEEPDLFLGFCALLEIFQGDVSPFFFATE